MAINLVSGLSWMKVLNCPAKPFLRLSAIVEKWMLPGAFSVRSNSRLWIRLRQEKYDDKCTTDPIRLTYNLAYKAHYARYMKKKMTVPEFEQWSAYAVELREKTLANKVGFEEYQDLIRA